MFLEQRNTPKILSNSQQCLSCLLDEWIAKKCKKIFLLGVFFLNPLYLFWDAHVTWTGRLNLKIFSEYDINYFKSIWPFMCHPWFHTRKASKLRFVCFQLQLFCPCIVFNNWSWTQINVSFKKDYFHFSKLRDENIYKYSQRHLIMIEQ